MLRMSSQSGQQTTHEAFHGRAAEALERDLRADALEWYAGAPQVNESANPPSQNAGGAHAV